MRERRVEKKGMIKWLGENGGELVGTNKYLCVQKKDLCVQIRFLCRLHKVEAQECYVWAVAPKNIKLVAAKMQTILMKA
jgi:hypothetical protein